MENERQTVVVRCDDERVGNALARRLAQDVGDRAEVFLGEAEPESSDPVVVTTDRSLTPPECAEMASHGARIVVLTALPNERAADRYRAAGARAYLPMAVSLAPLLTAITELLR